MPPTPDPFWVCHECHAHMRPMMVDDSPLCASCGGEFIEILDPEINPDPTYELPPPPPVRPQGTSSSSGRSDSNSGPRAHDPSAGLGGLFDLFTGGDGARAGGAGSRSPQPAAGGTGSGSSNRSWRFDFPGGGQGHVTFGTFGSGSGGFVGSFGGGTAGGTTGGGFGGPGQDGGLDVFFPGFAAPGRTPGDRDPRSAQGNDGPMDPQDLLSALMSIISEQEGMNMAFGPQGSANLGDYVMTQQGFDDVLERLMSAAGPQGPTPASDVVIEGLPRFQVDEKRLEESQFKDCPVCKDDFAVGEEVMQIPCRHIFHPDCLQPWLKVNGSCPVCRFSLVPDEANRPNRSTGPNRGSDNANVGGGSGVTGFLQRLFGGGGEEQGTPNSNPSATTATNPQHPPPPVAPASTSSPRQSTSSGPAMSGQQEPARTVDTSRTNAAPERSTSISREDHAGNAGEAESEAPPPLEYASAIPSDYRRRHLERERRQREEQTREPGSDDWYDDLD